MLVLLREWIKSTIFFFFPFFLTIQPILYLQLSSNVHAERRNDEQVRGKRKCKSWQHLNFQVTGIVVQLTVVHTILLAVQAASSVLLSIMTQLLTPHAQEPLEALGLHGNLVIGYSIGELAKFFFYVYKKV